MKKLLLLVTLLLAGCSAPTPERVVVVVTATSEPSQAPEPTQIPQIAESPTIASQPTLLSERISAETESLRVEVVEINQWVDSLTGDLNFVGILQNTGDIDAEFIRPVVTLRDSAGVLVASESADISFCSDILGVGQISPFWIRISPPGSWSTYDVNVQANEPLFFEASYYEAFDIISVQGRPSEFGGYRVVGEVRNSGEFDAQLSQVVVLLYDANEALIAAQCEIADIMEIPAGGTSPFDVELFLLPSNAEYRFEVFARGVRK